MALKIGSLGAAREAINRLLQTMQTQTSREVEPHF